MTRPLFREEALNSSGRTQHLEHILRVTAPHMWLVLVALGLASVGIVAWGLLGRVDRTVIGDCVLMQPGRSGEAVAAAGDDHRLEAEVPLSAEQAAHIERGMEATVVVTTSDTGEIRALQARISAPSRQPAVPSSQADRHATSAIAQSATVEHVVRIELLEAVPAGLTDGDSCTARIVLGRQAPVALLGRA